jgi:UDPglucose 6-dehydrogenase
MKITVVGAGYLGTTHSACMARIGHDVLVIENDRDKLAKLQSGEVPFFEPELEDALKEGLASGRLRFSDDYEEAAHFADIHFLAVGTPQDKQSSAADLSYVDAAIDSLCSRLTMPALIVGKSTVPVGTAQRLAERARKIAPVGDAVELAWNPEFLREGLAVRDTLHPDRVVIGVEDRDDARAAELLRTLYAPVLNDGKTPYVVTNLATAELVKAAANAFLATKISFINAIADLCEAASADVTQLADAIGYDERIGRRFLNAGLGFGGGCLPKDIRALIARADELGVGRSLDFLREVDGINMRQRSRIVAIARDECGSLAGKRVGILGLAFKPNTDDIRDSPALDVAGQLQLEGAEVSLYDPVAMDNSRKAFPMFNYALTASDACAGVDLVLVLTEWDEFRLMQPGDVAAVTRANRIVDARNCLDGAAWRAAGWAYRGFGRS